MNFAYPNLLWLCLAVVCFWWAAKYTTRTFGHPQLNIHRKSQLMSVLGFTARASQAAFWGCLVVAIAQPVVVKYTTIPKHGALVIIQQDGSESEFYGAKNAHELELAGPEFTASPTLKDPQHSYVMDRRQQKHSARRLDVSFAAIKLFLKNTYGNPVGLMIFDFGSYLAYPPTTNYQTLVETLPDLEEYMHADVPDGHGTNFEGTAQNQGALQGVIDLFKRVDPAMVKIHIMSTDGSAPISPKRQEELSAWYKKLGIHLFVFGVGEDWYENALAPDIQPLKDFVKAVGGTVVPVADKQAFDDAVAQLGQLAKSSVYITSGSTHEEAYLPWVLAAAAFLFVWLTGTIAVREGL